MFKPCFLIISLIFANALSIPISIPGNEKAKEQRQINYGYTDAVNYNYYYAMGHKNPYKNNEPNSENLNPNIIPNNNFNNYYITFTKQQLSSTPQTTTTSTTTTTIKTPLAKDSDHINETTQVIKTTITPQVLWWSRFNYLD